MMKIPVLRFGRSWRGLVAFAIALILLFPAAAGALEYVPASQPAYSPVANTDGEPPIAATAPNIPPAAPAQPLELVVQTGHSENMFNQVRSIAVTPDGKFLVTGSDDYTVKLWDIATGYEIRTFIGHTGGISTVAVTPDGTYLVTGSSDKTAKLWDFATGREVRTFSGHTSSIRSVAITPDGKFLVTGSGDYSTNSNSGDNTAKLWEIATGREVRTYSGHTRAIWSVAITPDGKWLVTGSEDKTAKLWHLDTGIEIRTFSGHTGGINSVAVTPDGKFLVTCGPSEDNYFGYPGGAKLWEIDTGREVQTFYRPVAATPDGKYLVIDQITDRYDRILQLYDLTARREIQTFGGGSNNGHSVAVTPDGKFLVAGMCLWEVATGRNVRTFSGHNLNIVSSVAITSDGKFLVTGGDAYTALWDLATGRKVRIFGTGSFIRSVAVTPDGKFLVIGNGDDNNTAKLWEVATGREVWTFSGRIDSIAVTPDGKYLITSGNPAKLWEIATGREIRTFSGYEYGISSVAVTPSGKYLVTGSGDETAILWDIATGREVRTFSGHTGGINSVAVTPDGKYLITGSGDNTAKLWDLATGLEVRTFNGHMGGINSVVVTADGKYLITGSGDNTAKLWDISAGRELRTFRGHISGIKVFRTEPVSEINSVAVTPDGKNLVTGGSDGQTILWELFTGRIIATLYSFTDGNWGAVTPDNYYTRSPDGEQCFAFRRGNELVEDAEFRREHNSPAIIRERLSVIHPVVPRPPIPPLNFPADLAPPRTQVPPPSTTAPTAANQSVPVVAYSLADLVEAIVPSVATIETFDQAGNSLGQGSGFLLAPSGYLVTNYHVIEGASRAVAFFYRFEGGRSVPLRADGYAITGVAGYSVGDDVAVLKLANLDRLKGLTISPRTPRPGEEVIAIGSPLGLEATVTRGIISAVRELPFGQRIIQTDAAISQGSSGGPLLDPEGRVLGINMAIARGGENIAWSVPATQIAPYLQSSRVSTLAAVAAVEVGPVRELARLLREFEANTKFSAQAPDWNNARELWAEATQSAVRIDDLAELMILFETSVKWNAMANEWGARRSQWIAEARQATSVPAMAALLIEFEGYMLWDSMDSSWRLRHELWRREVGALRPGR